MHFYWKGQISLFGLAYLLVGGYPVTRSLAIAQTKVLVSQTRMG
jgi:hypothetical protein